MVTLFLISVTCPELIFSFLHAVVWNFWNDHVLDWWKHKDDPNVLFLKYEDLQKVCLCEAFIFGCSRPSVSGKTRSCTLSAIFLELAVSV